MDTNIETEYFFAVNPSAAFVSLEAQIGDVVIKGVVKDKEIAKQEYKEALEQGKMAAYAEIIEDLHDIMKLNLGNLKPGQTIKIKLKYVEQLDVLLSKFWRFSIGNTFSDRSNSNPNSSPDLLKACNPDQIK